MSSKDLDMDNVFNEESQEASAFDDVAAQEQADIKGKQGGFVKKVLTYAVSAVVMGGVIGFIVYTNLERFGVSFSEEQVNQQPLSTVESNPVPPAPATHAAQQWNTHSDPLSPDGFMQQPALVAPSAPTVSQPAVKQQPEFFNAQPEFNQEQASANPAVVEKNFGTLASDPGVLDKVDDIESGVNNALAEISKVSERLSVLERSESDDIDSAAIEELSRKLTLLTNQQKELKDGLEKVQQDLAGQNKKIANAQANARLALRSIQASSQQGDAKRHSNSAPASTTSSKKANPPVERYVLKAIVQNQAWLQNSRGETLTISSGDVLPGFGRPSQFDTNGFRLCFDSKRCIGG